MGTTLSYFELTKLADSGNELAREVIRHRSIPLLLAFLSPEGRFVTKLTTLKELNHVHPDSSMRPEGPQYRSEDSAANNACVLIQHLDKYFPEMRNP
jgi:hypothetical protein